ncbi:histidine phosphatase family protein [Sulfitobacter mediterraneus]|uniref:histidine phosphatase family protein n=1 Tax=Sulfitobacter mediterraneus TaxID=83219 RepID=UPI00193321B8|nr:histidine phosphatase family protein [Sulfitobacter mediterraneus]MBM1309696.1 histidine phosphatase family protein [Sulfitobacter mediterraneus]MBM1313581.1 histidine phosphatase family protein [Sulfitobacter mediterraneus]MBM1321965.1 histidine phosphatase family protein [Sulfitobacter mediterraneus]MBM1325852.1 histidine phosphatase family protein [Sulfitobacter mediterraneus]MBM1397198.1 histidine phosphatase family protein [Sulfitobacter mediterraneus]
MTNDYPKIWFLRHGQTEWNREFRLQGQLDSPLTQQGQAEAARQAKIMPEILAQNPAIYASPLGRVRQTAQIALGDVPRQEDARLMEIHAGKWQGMTRTEILADRPEWAAKSPTPLEIYEAADGGEGLAAFHARIVDFLNDLTGPSVIVAHGLLGQVLRAEVCGLSTSQAGSLSNLQGCVYLLEYGQETVLEAPE